MSGLRLTVHRATQQIGGNCIELASPDGSRLFLDVGRPLDAPESATNLLPDTVDTSTDCLGVLISHPHQDHYGLLGELPAGWPVYCGAASEQLIRLTAAIRGGMFSQSFRNWHSKQPFQLGTFRITPYLTDHSAFDAYMLLIEAAGRRILYSGDFRRHGRKSSLVQHLLDHPPADLDVLLLEGTNLGSDKPVMTEAQLEQDFLALLRQTHGRVFVAWSAQNIDRTVTLYRACRQSGRILVVDLYCGTGIAVAG